MAPNQEWIAAASAAVVSASSRAHAKPLFSKELVVA
jgi:hypothetical protein